MIRSDTTIHIQLVDQERKAFRLGHVSIDAVFFVGGRERYRFDVGFTNDEGQVTTSCARFEDILMDNRRFSLMDYNTDLEECDDEMLLRAPSIDELESRLKALVKWFPDNAPSLEDVLQRTNNDKIHLVERKISLKDISVYAELTCRAVPTR